MTALWSAAKKVVPYH